jgi:hypothetical protein
MTLPVTDLQVLRITPSFQRQLTDKECTMRDICPLHIPQFRTHLHNTLEGIGRTNFQRDHI